MSDHGTEVQSWESLRDSLSLQRQATEHAIDELRKAQSELSEERQKRSKLVEIIDNDMHIINTNWLRQNGARDVADIIEKIRDLLRKETK